MLTTEKTEILKQLLGDLLGSGKALDHDRALQAARKTDLPLRDVESAALDMEIIPERYNRNMGTLGAEGQRRLLSKSVIVVGLGGLGGHVVEILARLGVGRIVGIDFDVFSENNLNRQIFSTVDNVGKSKAEQAKLRLAEINPAVDFTGFAQPFQDAEDRVFDESDLVFDCLDDIPARLVLADRCTSAGVFLVHGAIAGWCGQTAVVEPGSDLLGKLYRGEKDGLEKQSGNLPFTAAVAANIMAAKGTQVLLGRLPASRPPVEFFDLEEGDWQSVEL